MNKVTPAPKIAAFLFAAPLILAGCASSGSALKPSPRGGGVHRVAVLPFESSNPYLSGVFFSDSFTVRILREILGLQVIERKDMMKVLHEQKLGLTGVLRPEKFSQLGSILGVEAILTGSVQVLQPIHGAGGSISVTVKLMEVSTGKVLWADRRKVSHASWSVGETEEVADALIEKAAEKMVGRLKGDLKCGLLAAVQTEESVQESKLPARGR